MKEENEIIDKALEIYSELKNNGFDRGDVEILLAIIQAINLKNDV